MLCSRCLPHLWFSSRGQARDPPPSCRILKKAEMTGLLREPSAAGMSARESGQTVDSMRIGSPGRGRGCAVPGR